MVELKLVPKNPVHIPFQNPNPIYHFTPLTNTPPVRTLNLIPQLTLAKGRKLLSYVTGLGQKRLKNHLLPTGAI